jgi:ABC-2 type transport system permease protein
MTAVPHVRWPRVRAIVRREALSLRRSPERWFDVTVWPVVDVLLFGSLGVFLDDATGAQEQGVAYLLTGILLWHVIYQSQIAVSTGFLEETWSRNLLNVMVTPITELEYLVALVVFAAARLAMGLAMLALTALAFYAFDVTSAGWGLIPIGFELLLVGWVIALFVVGLLLRFGQGAEILAWGIMFVLMPTSGVFYPVDALPGSLQPFAHLLPTTHAFAAARELVAGNPLPWDEVGLAAIGCVVSALAGLAFVLRMLRVFRARGYVTRYS